MINFFEKNKKNNLNEIYEFFLNEYNNDLTLINHRTYIEDNNLDLFKTNADNLIQYTNEQLDKINKRYKSYSNTYHIRTR